MSSVAILVIIALGIGVYQKLNNTKAPEPILAQTIVSQQVVQQNFSCDGRQHCSEMRSYEEALYFLKNCPNTKMDGDRDGIPCENDSRW